jgi:hypothetical protein
MHTYQSQHQEHHVSGSGFQRFLFVLIGIGLSAIVICLLVLDQVCSTLQRPGGQLPSTVVVVLSPQPSPTLMLSPTRVPTATPTANMAQRIDAYINHLTRTQQIGQLLMSHVYTNNYTAVLNQPL